MAGGLAMLLGFVMLGEAAGTYRISEILADPPRGGPVTAAVVLVLAGAFAKSAQMPLRGWLPAAMVAPTPVSAHLHAAATVKAGVYLIARFAPGFADVAPWRPLVLTVGLTTLVLGAWRALRETDLKMVALLQLVTVPVTAQIVGRASYRSDSLHRPGLVADELRDRLARDDASAPDDTGTGAGLDPDADR